MSRMIQDAYIVAAQRTPVGKAPRGLLRQTRPDDLLVHAIQAVLAQVPQLDPSSIEDVIVGCAMPEAEQGMNVARMALLLAGLPEQVSGMTINRFCASGLNAVALAAQRIQLGEADVMLAGGAESMSLIPMMGHHPAFNPLALTAEHLGMAYGMGLTAEQVAQRWQVSREDQDAFALQSHQRALAAQAAGAFGAEIAPISLQHTVIDPHTHQPQSRSTLMSQDEGPRADTTLAALAQLRPAFAAQGSVTAGNSSQMSDGAAAVLLVSEAALQRFQLTPLARFAGFAVAGVAPEVMGIGPVEAIPRVLRQAQISLQEVDWIELNEAFAAQSLAVVRTLDLDPARVNPQGGAIALGHPLGATGAIRTASLVHGLQRTRQRYGMVTMCVGTGMGAAGLFERC